MREVTVQRTIKEGQVLRIHPTEAFQGIHRGLINVNTIHDNALGDTKVGNAAADWLRELTCGLEPDEVQELTDEYTNCKWVEYRYSRVSDKGAESEVGIPQYLPLDVFADSITSY